MEAKQQNSTANSKQHATRGAQKEQQKQQSHGIVVVMEVAVTMAQRYLQENFSSMNSWFHSLPTFKHPNCECSTYYDYCYYYALLLLLLLFVLLLCFLQVSI